MLQQRAIDRCLYRPLQARCGLLTSLSKSNARLREITNALAAIEAAKTLAKVIPGVGAVASTAGTASAEVLRAAARGLATLQELQVRSAPLQTFSLFACGIPIRGIGPMRFSRPLQALAKAMEVPSPLKWTSGPESSEMHVLKLSSGSRGWYESFGHCAAREEPSDALDGEKYDVVFTHFIKRANADNPLSKSFSSWHSWR